MTVLDLSGFDPVNDVWPVQDVDCECCPPIEYDMGKGCAYVVPSERTGRCVMWYGPDTDLKLCKHYGSKADGGLCEHCYLSTK